MHLDDNVRVHLERARRIQKGTVQIYDYGFAFTRKALRVILNAD
jgi:hypothetical protein